MQSRSRRIHPSWRLTASLLTLALALAVPALAGDQTNGNKATDPNSAKTVEVGEATIRWHFDAAPKSMTESPLLARYQALTAARFTGEKVAPAEKAEAEPLADGTLKVLVPVEQAHTLFVDGAGRNVCSKAGHVHGDKAAPSTRAGEDR